LAYLSIGEAEDYRYYFDEVWIAALGKQPSAAAPCWLGRTNPDWEGNYKVQYWSEAWQANVLDYLDKILDDGFDGVYLDIIDAYEYWADEDNREGFFLDEDVAASRMINFVKRIAYHARITRGAADFLILPQNGSPILDYDDGIHNLGAGDYLNTISGIGIEDLYYNETEAVAPSATDYRTSYLQRIQDTGKKVLVVDYVDDQSDTGENNAKIAAFLASASADGYLPYAATSDRGLAAINPQP
jgi:cysteinyl-tRNA synthetase